MKAFAVTEKNHRSIEQISLIDVPVPDISAEQVLIQVQAVGLNPVDYKIVEFGVESWCYPHVLGLDVAGVVTAVGENVQHFTVGDRVCGHGDLTRNGCFAEYVAAPAYQLAKIPDEVSNEQAAALLCAGMTAYQAIYRKAELTKRRTALIHAASGGVGSIALQLAKLAGLTVYATASTAKVPFVQQLNAADYIIDYQQENVTRKILELTGGNGADLIINTVDGKSATEDLTRLAYNGALVTVVELPDFTQAGLFEFAQSVCMVNLGGAHQSNNAAQQADLGNIAQILLSLVAEDKLDPLLTAVLPFEDIPTGLQMIKARQTVGKIVAVL